MNATHIDMNSMDTAIPLCQVPRALAQARIPIHKWNTTQNGAVADFMNMLQQEAVTLQQDNGRLTIHIMVAVPYIGYYESGKMQELYEAYQLQMDEMNPGRIAFKSRGFNGSLGETMRRYWDGRIENGRVATERGLREELGWEDSTLYELSPWHGSTWETLGPLPSCKYPGLQSVYHRYKMHCIIGRALYKPDGYVHIDAAKKKKEVFLWKDI